MFFASTNCTTSKIAQSSSPCPKILGFAFIIGDEGGPVQEQKYGWYNEHQPGGRESVRAQKRSPLSLEGATLNASSSSRLRRRSWLASAHPRIGPHWRSTQPALTQADAGEAPHLNLLQVDAGWLPQLRSLQIDAGESPYFDCFLVDAGGSLSLDCLQVKVDGSTNSIASRSALTVRPSSISLRPAMADHSSSIFFRSKLEDSSSYLQVAELPSSIFFRLALADPPSLLPLHFHSMATLAWNPAHKKILQSEVLFWSHPDCSLHQSVHLGLGFQPCPHSGNVSPIQPFVVIRDPELLGSRYFKLDSLVSYFTIILRLFDKTNTLPINILNL